MSVTKYEPLAWEKSAAGVPESEEVVKGVIFNEDGVALIALQNTRAQFRATLQPTDIGYAIGILKYGNNGAADGITCLHFLPPYTVSPITREIFFEEEGLPEGEEDPLDFGEDD